MALADRPDETNGVVTKYFPRSGFGFIDNRFFFHVERIQRSNPKPGESPLYGKDGFNLDIRSASESANPTKVVYTPTVNARGGVAHNVRIVEE